MERFDGRAERAGWRRRSLLVLLAGAHVAVFLLPSAPRPALRPQLQQRISWLRLVAEPQPVPTPARQSASVHTLVAHPVHAPVALAPVAPPVPATPITPPVTAAQQAQQPQPDYFAITPARPAPGDALQAAKRAAGAVDRQLRKEAWNPHDKFVANDQTALAKGLSAAFVGDEGVRYEELTLPDGRHMTVVHAHGGTYCAYKESNAIVGGRDVFRDGVKTKISTCPM